MSGDLKFQSLIIWIFNLFQKNVNTIFPNQFWAFWTSIASPRFAELNRFFFLWSSRDVWRVADGRQTEGAKWLNAQSLRCHQKQTWPTSILREDSAGSAADGDTGRYGSAVAMVTDPKAQGGDPDE